MKARFDTRDFSGPTPRFGVCLLHGNDADLVEERCSALTRLVAGSLDDPFQVATLGADDHANLAAEVTAGSLMGGRRVVRVREVGDRLVPALERVTAGGTGSTAVLLMAGALTMRSKLRTWAEQDPGVAAVLCSQDDPAQRRAFIEGMLQKAQLSTSSDVRGLLADRLPPGRRSIVAEVEKLALLSDSGQVEWTDAAALLDGAEGSSIHAAIDAALGGHEAEALTAWERAFEAGASGVGFVRVAGGELTRLAGLLEQVERGTPVKDALERQRIYGRDPRFKRWAAMLQRWTGAAAMSALARVLQAERACKTTGADERLVVSHLLTGLARSRASGPSRSR